MRYKFLHCPPSSKPPTCSKLGARVAGVVVRRNVGYESIANRGGTIQSKHGVDSFAKFDCVSLIDAEGVDLKVIEAIVVGLLTASKKFERPKT